VITIPHRRNFLVGRKQKVVLNGHQSDWSDVISGVPQGSVLGPILFNIYVSNMPSVVSSRILQFADDVKMFRTIKSFNDFVQLQQDINSLAEWTSKWQLKFNVSKCNWLHLGRQHGFEEYTVGGIVIASCNVVRDLGIQIDSHLKFHEHTTVLTKKANQLLSIIIKFFIILTYAKLISDLFWSMEVSSGDLYLF